ncbi:UTP--glucose-1-phosphate uridylyltransferase 3, chloroplastic isoform X2 [Cryptomeria japonica]|uniref:UTP--glucose-1-phosphate uridylyltransferase 3, chloroplastic isoform X2 n=1 Tax=Cryptomeria japonica TaxID=3369 RepID=UPI0027DA9ABC|nr:UTP--glucose-1-phosphate uridylyltransferase 3, chloroplastic isoform X2 [Cryptomeria japonica]
MLDLFTEQISSALCSSLSAMASCRNASSRGIANNDAGRQIGLVSTKLTRHSFRNLGVERKTPKSCSASRFPVTRRLIAIKAVSIIDAPVQSSSPLSNLEQELRDLKIVQAKLRAAKTERDKIEIINRQRRVTSFLERKEQLKDLFDFEKLGERQFYLLKCLVAIGQEHVLFIEQSWLDLKQGPENGGQVRSSSPLKNALYVLLSMIDNWEKTGNYAKNHMFLNLKTGENSVKTVHAKNKTWKEEISHALDGLLTTLEDVETFYDCIGGIVGYQAAVLELILASKKEWHSLSSQFHQEFSVSSSLNECYVPLGPDLSKNIEYAAQAAVWGIEGLPELGEVYPLGGSGDRLGLIDKETGHSLPVAMLPYCGRTLLEGLIRDLQAREFLYYKIYEKQHITPVAIMTSAAKDNHKHIMALCEKHEWFGRGRRSFQLFEQPLVPTVDADDGKWVKSEPFKLVLKPGGHGVIWKLASDKGIFNWFYSHGCKSATVRQISNPVAATDVTLLALAGIGLHNGKKLGFASCQRRVGATEGVNVLLERNTIAGCWEYGLTCIEYTEFDKLGIIDAPVSPGSVQAQYPANTNVLYVDLATVERIGSSKSEASLPGMILNLKKPIIYEDYLGVKHSIYAGRLECTMQNVADSLFTSFPNRCFSNVQENLDTFIVYNERRKVTSSAKKERKAKDKSLHQTPDGSFLDVMRNAYDLLVSCNIQMDKVEDNASYLNSGPPFLVFLHPALGPLWEVTRQKFHGGSIAKGSELQLEIAEFSWVDVQLDGSLIILAENIMGFKKALENEDPVLQYGQQCGKCRLQNVKISNKGVDWKSSENVYWQQKVHRLETVKIVLHGNAEFDACDVVLEGDHFFEVPDGHRLQITSGDSGLSSTMKPIIDEMSICGSWYWKYTLDNSHFNLEMVEL